MKDVIFKKVNKSGQIILNRPEKINSLTHEMIVEIDEKLEEWEKDNDVFFVVMYGAGNKGFCSGGDMKIFYEEKERALEIGKKFFPSEYDMDLRIIHYPKPVIALLDGFVMGGGVGISYGAAYRIVTETTKWAMPETNIGFFPDVGGSFFLNQIPGEIARYITFLSKVVSGDDVLRLGYAERKVFKADIENILEEFSNIIEDDVEIEIERILEKHEQPYEKSYLEKNEDKIKLYFSDDSVEKIIDKLKKGSESGDIWAEETLKMMRKKSLLSQYIIMEQLKRSTTLSIEECFEMEIILALNFMDNPDFFEGLRSVLIDKDTPKWKYKEPKDISEALVNSYFIK